MKNSSLYYSVGALLYCPANNTSIADSIINNKFGRRFSLALCLEDTINDNFVPQAEHLLTVSLEKIYRALSEMEFYLPKIFIRIRNSEQIPRLYHMLKKSASLVTGFIVPKFSLSNADDYIHTICNLNETAGQPVYMMPIYESPSIIDLRKRYDILYALKEKTDLIEELILNIRVGGNDLCHVFGYRRHADESIHRIRPIAQIFSDINTVYGMDYVISGPVWEYFNGTNWEQGLRNEISDDRLCGFTGKTVIHPRQISIVNDTYAVTAADFASANAILNWKKETPSFVSSDPGKERMNEYKTHTNWAQKILFLADCYGIRH